MKEKPYLVEIESKTKRDDHGHKKVFYRIACEGLIPKWWSKKHGWVVAHSRNKKHFATFYSKAKAEKEIEKILKKDTPAPSTSVPQFTSYILKDVPAFIEPFKVGIYGMVEGESEIHTVGEFDDKAQAEDVAKRLGIFNKMKDLS